MRITILIVLLELMYFTTVGQRTRLVVTTDIGQDPDDEQSMVRLLHYANEFEIEGLIANADTNSDTEPPVLKEYIIHDMIEAYASISATLKTHDPEYPDADYLHSVVKKGCYGNGVDVPYAEFIGAGRDTEGSSWIIQVVDRVDHRPVNISVWGGACDLAQALWKIQYTRSAAEVDAFVKKLRVFFIGKQDSSNAWVMENFPDLWLILALDRAGDKWESGYRGMFWGGDMSLTSKSWLHEHVIGQNPLADLYPDKAYTGGEYRNPHMAMKEGDSPAFLYFLMNGLNSPEHPSWGGWGGRYEIEYNQVSGDANDTYFDEQADKEISSPRATVFRWRPDFQHDFATRVKWGMQQYKDANHHPKLKVNGIGGNSPLILQVNAGKKIKLDAAGSTDPDGDGITYQWMLYPEAGTFKGIVSIDNAGKETCAVNIPELAKGMTIQVILRVKDLRELSLTSYKRILISVN